jgi:hypothetical protein
MSRLTRRTGLAAVPAAAAAILAAPAFAIAQDAASTEVSATVNRFVAVTAPSAIDFGAVAVGSDNRAAGTLTVVSNDPSAAVSVQRTAFGTTPADLSLRILGADLTDWTEIPVSGALALEDATGLTAEAGTGYALGFRLGVPYVRAGAARATVTFTVATP